MRRNFYAWSMAALLVAGLTSCSNKNDEPQPDETEYGKLAFTINFTNSGTRAEGDGSGTGNLPNKDEANGSTEVDAVSNAVPLTSWDNVESLQLFLYDTNGVIHFSDLISQDQIKNTLQTNPTENGSVTYTYANVPAGSYRLMAVANVNTADTETAAKVKTEIAGQEQTWTAYNVINRFIYNCHISCAQTAFPIFYQNQVAASGQIRRELPLSTPTEIFLGQGFTSGNNEEVLVESQKTVAATISLKREVSMMRLRLCLAGQKNEAGEIVLNNADVNKTAGGLVDFSRNASIMIATVPDYVIPMAKDRQVGTEWLRAGTSWTSSASSIFVPGFAEGTRCFYSANPTSGYKEGGKIIGIEGDRYNADSWRDIIVLPNNNRQQTSGSAANEPLLQNRYLLIISAMGLPGHVTKEGTLTEEKTVYWVGYINQGFTANKIREVNIVFRDGGTQELPERPDNTGNLTVTVNRPLDWDAAVQASELPL